MENEIVEFVYQSKGDSIKADELIRKYLPYIKSETSKVAGKVITDSDDELSIAMIGFHEAIETYSKFKGAFLNYAKVVMRNKIIDFYRKENKHMGNLSMEANITGQENLVLSDTIKDEMDEYDSLSLRDATGEEIEELSRQLQEYNISFTDISDNTPKQKRTLGACRKIISYVRSNPSIIDDVIKTKKLPIKKLSLETGVSSKTIERHRTYLMALIIIYSNGYEIIRGHIKQVLNLQKVGEII